MYPSIWQILIVLLILLLLFGHKRIKELGKALGESLRDFKKGLEDEPRTPPASQVSQSQKENDSSKDNTNQAK